MNLLTKYILFYYLKYFLIILVSLELFFVGIDFIQHVKSLPDSANLQLLYLLYNGFFTLTITLPLSLVFGWILTLTTLIKNNELVSFYALGVSKSDVLKPILSVSILMTLVLIALQSTPLAYSYDEKKKIMNNHYFSSEQNNIFLKYNNYFIHFKKLFPLEKKATDVTIFKIENNTIVEVVNGDKAHYQNGKWYVTNTQIASKPQEILWDSSKLTINHEKFLATLEGFEPKIINNVYSGKTQFSIIDAIYAILLLNNQDFNTNKIKSILYAQIFIPFFIIPLIILIYLFVSASSRFFNNAKFLSLSIFLTLVAWGVMFLLQKLAFGGIVIAEFAIIMPLVILYTVTIYLFKQRVNI